MGGHLGIQSTVDDILYEVLPNADTDLDMCLEQKKSIYFYVDISSSAFD